MSKNISIEEFLEGSYAEPIDLSMIPDFQEVINDEEHIDKRSRQTADQLPDNKDGILYDLLNIVHPDFNLREEFNTISIFFHTYDSIYHEFKQLLIEYAINANEEKNVDKARELKTIIMQFIADKMNNGK